MYNFLKAVPVPICGLILGLASLGNLLKMYHFVLIGNMVGIVSMILMFFMLAKLFFLFEHTKQTLRDPVIASVSPTFTMALMIICTYFTAFTSISLVIKLIWLCIVIFQVVLVLYFNYHHVIKADFSIELIYPSWFIVYVGFGVITVTAGNYFPMIGKVFFWVSLISYAFLLPFIIKRIFLTKGMPVPTQPLITILAAPGSLCLTGYLKIFKHPNLYLVGFLFVVSQVLYFLVLSMLPTLFKIKFYPSFSAFTFPLVISATAMFSVTHYFNNLGFHSGLLEILNVVETIVACLVVFYVLIRYLVFLLSNIKSSNSIQTKKIV